MSRPLTRKRNNSNTKQSKKADIPVIDDIKFINSVAKYKNLNNIEILDKNTFLARAVLIPNKKKIFDRILIYKFKINRNIIYDFHPVVYDLLYRIYNYKTIESILQYFRENIKQKQGILLTIKPTKDIMDFISNQLKLYNFEHKFSIEQYVKKKTILYLKGENKNVFEYEPIVIKNNSNNNIIKKVSNVNNDEKITEIKMGEAFSNNNIKLTPHENTPTQPVNN